jgi:ribosomal protein S18 acetylase RimI-like enzyme
MSRRDERESGCAITVRAALERDGEELAMLFDEYRAFYGETRSPERVLALVREQTVSGKTRFFVATKDSGEELAGFVHLIPSLNTLAIRPIWYLEDLFVRPEARRSGIATALMEYAERFARETGAERLTLATAHDNASAQALYRKLGYVREDHFVYYHRLLG